MRENKVTKFHVGPIHSPVAGRTDHLPMEVESGSYVIPADIVSAMGEGNTMAGFKHMRRMFGGGQYQQGPDPYAQSNGPYGEKIGKAHGGPVKVRASGIMFINPKEQVLLMKRVGNDHANKWAFPAGKIEKGETPETAARREFREETGHQYKGTLRRIEQTAKDGVHFTTFQAEVENFKPKLNEEHSAYGWFSPAAAIEQLDLHPGVKETLKERIHKAGGGSLNDDKPGPNGCKIVAAGGEYVLSPEQVKHTAGHGDLDRGHRVLDEFVKRMRAHTVKTLQRLPGPRKD